MMIEGAAEGTGFVDGAGLGGGADVAADAGADTFGADPADEQLTLDGEEEWAEDEKPKGNDVRKNSMSEL